MCGFGNEGERRATSPPRGRHAPSPTACGRAYFLSHTHVHPYTDTPSSLGNQQPHNTSTNYRRQRRLHHQRVNSQRKRGGIQWKVCESSARLMYALRNKGCLQSRRLEAFVSLLYCLVTTCVHPGTSPLPNPTLSTCFKLHQTRRKEPRHRVMEESVHVTVLVVVVETCNMMQEARLSAP